jgi:hypothetical protein
MSYMLQRLHQHGGDGSTLFSKLRVYACCKRFLLAQIKSPPIESFICDAYDRQVSMSLQKLSLSKLHFVQVEKGIRRPPIGQTSHGRLIMAAMMMAAAVALFVAASVAVYVAASVSLSVVATAAVSFLVTAAAVAVMMISASDAVTAVIVSPVILVRWRMRRRRRVALRQMPAHPTEEHIFASCLALFARNLRAHFLRHLLTLVDGERLALLARHCLAGLPGNIFAHLARDLLTAGLHDAAALLTRHAVALLPQVRHAGLLGHVAALLLRHAAAGLARDGAAGLTWD